MFSLFSRQGLPRSRTASLIAASAMLAVPALLSLTPSDAKACACGCGVFEVGTSSMLPSGAGGTVFLGIDFQNQNINWSGGHSAPSANNGDKEIQTEFYTAGFQYMFNRSWGMQVEVPVWNRYFATDVNYPTGPENVQSTQWWGVGDVRLKGIYTGFSDDMSTGLTYGVKLPTGNNNYQPSGANYGMVDSDSQIGTGSTDILLGGFHRQNLNEDWTAFGQAQLDAPVLIQNQYRPGWELDLAVGAYYNGWTIGNVMVTPLAQAIVSLRGRDSGANAASPVASGYERLILSPGVELAWGQFSFYVDVEVPVLQNFNGNQLTAPFMIKSFLAYNF